MLFCKLLLDCFLTIIYLEYYYLGWMTSSLFLNVMEHFFKHSNASIDNQVLLIMDNHESHLSIDAIEYAKQHGVTLLTIHPHCSHKLQPLDVSIYGPFKSYYSSALNAQLQQKPGVSLTICDISGLVKIAHEKAMTPTNIIAGFKKTGVFSLDKHIFDEYDFLPSLVTNQPNDASANNLHLEENKSLDNIDFQLQDLGSLNDVDIQNPETFQNNFISRTGNWLSKSSQKKKKTPEKKKRL